LALKASKEPEHPLSQSLTASPELKSTGRFSENDSTLESPMHLPVESHPFGFYERPAVLERGMSATGSIRTIRQSDIAALSDSGPSTMPAMPSTPQALEGPPPGFGAIFGGAKKKILKKIRTSSRESQKRQAKASSSDVSSLDQVQTHGEPSIAVSTAMATGEVRAALESTGGLGSALPSPASVATPGRGQHEAGLGGAAQGGWSRESSMSSPRSGRNGPLIA